MGDGVSDIMELIEMTYSVLICDDDDILAAERVERIKKIAPRNYEIRDAPSAKEMCGAVSELLRRRKIIRGGHLYVPEPCLFDQKDILIIDYDLIHVDDERAQHTGEGIGRLARMYSDCAVVVVFNQFGQVDFDLSLRGHLASHADLNLTAELLDTLGLWTEPPWQGFRRWSWQTLSRGVEGQRAREKAFRCNLDRSIVDTFGIESDDALGISDSAVGFIAPEASNFDELRAMTFRSFVSMTAGRDGKLLLSSDESAAVRLGAARIGKWLDRQVLGPQDVLIDVPHLLQRFPFLLGKEVADIKAWNAAVHQADYLTQYIDASYWFEPAVCLSKPAVWVRRLEADPEFSKRRADFSNYSLIPDVVFMEDCSVFEDISCGTEFRAGFYNSFDRRYVKNIRGIRYGPQRRFAFGSD